MSNNARVAEQGRTTRHVRTVIPSDTHERLRHLAVDLHTTLADLITDALILLLRYHGRGEGLGKPVPPAVPAENEAGR